MALEKLLDLYGEIHDLHMAGAVLRWDQQVCMPPRGAAARGRQLATLGGIAHERLTGAAFRAALDEARAADPQDAESRAVLREITHQFDRATRLPNSLVRELELAESKAHHSWEKARALNRFDLFAPDLRRIVELVRQKADCFGWEDTPWDALGDDYERGIPAARIAALFEPLKQSTIALLDKLRGRSVDTSFLSQNWSLEAQREFGLRVARDIGYDLAAGRLDIATHPFCTNFSPGDVRITTRYGLDSPFESLGGIIHEAGHALYEQGFTADERSPLGNAPSMGMHESQSRFWEVRIAQSRPFWHHYLPIMRQYFPGRLDDVTPEQVYAAVNRVEPGYIRVEADEVTYNLHVIIRFELELLLIGGQMDVADLPAAWNDRYEKYLGLRPRNDREGCLQDIHWSGGAFGYFPSYTFGNIYAAMLTEAMVRDLPDMWSLVARGDFAPILAWLRGRIHAAGSRHLAGELVESVCGRSLSTAPLVHHLERKYIDLYNL
jgi:carboxypeptidase Taq